MTKIYFKLGAIGNDSRLWIDNEEVRGARSAVVRVAVGELTTAEIEYACTEGVTLEGVDIVAHHSCPLSVSADESDPVTLMAALESLFPGCSIECEDGDEWVVHTGYAARPYDGRMVRLT